MSIAARHDVIVLGMGPVGCLVTILLASRGLSVISIERDRQVYGLPRAVVLDGEIVRALQPAGLADAVDALLQKVRPGDRAGFANSKREWMFGQDSVPFGSNGWQPANMFIQPELEGFLRAQALASPRVIPHIGFAATGFTQDDSGVTLAMAPIEGGESRTIRADWMIACDGASSTTRRALGIEWKSLGYDHEWLVVDVIVKPGHTLGNSTLQVCDPDRLTTYVCTKDPYRRWEFKLLPGETREHMLKNETIQRLIDPWTPRGTYDISRAAVYQFHAATAAEWRSGRVLIAGDAAHQTPPFLGQGMNTGMRDAVNLGWKLPLIQQRICDPAMLDSYRVERQAHAEDLIDWAVSIGRLMEHMAEVERAAQAGRNPPATPPTLKAAGYGQGRGQPPLREGVLLSDQVNDNGATGYLFAQPIVRDTSGKTFLLDEALGDSFALVAKSADALNISAEADTILRRLNSRKLSLEGLTLVRGHFDRIFETADVVLVRPDRYIFGHTDATRDANALVAALASALKLQSQPADWTAHADNAG